MAGFHRCPRRHVVGVLVAAISFCVATSADAQTTWSATPANGNLNDAGNWAGGSLPATTSAWVFGSSSATTLTNDFTAGRANNGITFAADAGSYTISGNSIALNGTITNTTALTQTINADLTISATRSLALSASGGTLVLGGNISGAGGVTATGPGSGVSSLTLSGSNAFAGTVTANQRVGLNINNPYALGSASLLTVRNTGVIDNTSGADIQLAKTHNILVGGNDGGFTFNTTRSLDFGDNTFSYTNNMGLTVNGSRTITLGSLTPSGASASTWAFTKAGTGILTLRNAASASMAGAVTLSGGVVQIGNDRSLGDGAITFSGATLQSLNGPRVLSNTISLGGVTATPSIVSGTNSVSFSGAVTGATGNPRVLSNNLAPTALLTITNLGLNADTTNARNLTLSGSGNTLITGTISNGNASRAQNLIVDNTGITTISGTSSYGGTTQVNGGTLVFRSTAAKAAGTVTAAAGGSIGLGVGGSGDYSSANVAALFGNTLTGFTMNAASGVAVDTTAGDFTISDVLAGSRSFSKLGANTLVLSASNTFNGTSAVRQGRLVVNGRVAGAVNVDSGAVLGGSGAVGGLATITGTHAPGNSPGVQTFESGISYQAGSTLAWELWGNTATQGAGTLASPFTFDQVLVTGSSLSIAPTASLSLDFGALAGGSVVDWDNGFWSANRSWTVIDVTAGSATAADATLFTLLGSPSSWVDASGQSLDSSVRSGASFSVSRAADGDVLLSYVVPVPEPEAILMAGVGIAVAGRSLWKRRRRRCTP